MRVCYTCDREITDEEFETYDDRSKAEYRLSGMCLDPCQNEVFEGDHYDNWWEEEGDDND